MANEGAVADAGAAAAAAGAGAVADAGKAADAGKSILDGAVAPGKGEPNGKSSDDAGKAADAAKAGEAGKQAGSPTDKGATGAPEKYETFKVPEGVTFDSKAREQFQVTAKELGLSQDAAQKLVDFQATQVKAAQDQSLKDFAEMQKTWAAETRKALGVNADKELAFAAVARDKFFGPKAMEVLNGSGLANHPDVISSLISIGKAISEDKIVEGEGAKPGKNAGKTPAQVIYPDQK